VSGPLTSPGPLMSRILLLLSFLCVAFALAVALMKPLLSRAANGVAPTAPAPTQGDAKPVSTQLPVVKKKRRTTQLHLPFGTQVADFAKHFLGTRYVYGGSSPRSGFDCSGLMRYVYGHFGISLPHSSYAQFDQGRRIGRWALRPGDLVFFDGLGHVGMYIGNGRFIHAPHSGTRVRIETLAGWYGARFVGGRRLRAA
jgi:cell wall-associated NlpC family hydrolase